MFDGASAFDQPLSGWDVSRVQNFQAMFQLSPFNQDISGWNVASATDMNHMFNVANSFNKALSGWDVSKVVNFRAMFASTPFNGGECDASAKLLEASRVAIFG